MQVNAIALYLEHATLDTIRLYMERAYVTGDADIIEAASVVVARAKNLGMCVCVAL